MTTVKVKILPPTPGDEPPPGRYHLLYDVPTSFSWQIITSYKEFQVGVDDEQSQLVPIIDSGREHIIKSIRQQIQSDTARLSSIIQRLDTKQAEYTSDDAIAESSQKDASPTLFTFMRDAVSRLKSGLGHAGTAKNYNATLNSFMRFRMYKDIPIEHIDDTLMEDYQAYLISNGLVPNSISFYMRILRAIYNRAIGQGLTKDRKPFRTVFTGTEKTLKRAISINDIRRIKDMNLQPHPDLEFARDMFLFMFLCRGMSFIDAAFLKKSDVSGGILTYRRHKTGQLLHIKIVKQIKDLISRYSKTGSPYLLPIITRAGVDERKQYETALRRMNKHLEVIAKMTNRPITLTTHVSRHAWATIAKSKNVPINVISDALGHNSITTTQIYLATIDASTIHHANDMIMKDL